MPAATGAGTAIGSRSRASNGHGRTPSTKDDEWAEPPLQEAKASFEDHGGGAFGVLEDMLPLGARPNAKVRSRVRADPLRRSNLGKNAGTVGVLSDAQEVQDTPETTPGTDVVGHATATIEDAPPTAQPLVIFDDEKDQDYMPRQPKRSTKLRSSRSGGAKNVSSPAPAASASAPSPTLKHTRTKPAATSTSHTRSRSPVLSPAPDRARARGPASSSGAPASSVPPPHLSSPVLPAASRRSSRPSSTPKLEMSETPMPPAPGLGAIVEAAVRRSREVGNPMVGLALRQLYAESVDNDRLVHLIGVMLDQTADVLEMREFRRHVNRVKRQIRREEEFGREPSDSKSPDLANGAGASTSDELVGQPTRPELVPRPSIEAPTSHHRPKITLRVKPKVKVNGDMAMARARSVSTSSSLSSLTSNDDIMDIDAADEHSAPEMPHTGQANALSAPRSSLKRSSADAEYDEHDEILAMKKKKLSEAVNREDLARPSHVRLDPLARKSRASTGASRAAPGRPATPPDNESPATGSALSTPSTALDSPPPEIHSPPPAESTKPFQKRAKTKQSPVKKLTRTHEGETNDNSGGESPIGEDEESEDSDLCSSCKGSGLLLCCDGCDRSFHLTCLDPPIAQDASELNEPWYCYQCTSAMRPRKQQQQQQQQQRGLFSALMTNLDKRNPKVFSLPQDIRDYYAGVSTGKDGRFIEVPSYKKTKSRGVAFDEMPDTFKTRDSKGNAVLCHQCHKSSHGQREIITCDQCGVHWHLDCLDPPLAGLPNRDLYGKKAREWICPLHVEHVMRNIEVERLAERQTELNRRIFKRRPRNPKITDTALSRGFINDGIIEIANDDSDDDADFYEEEIAGTVHRLPEKGIKLDFIAAVRKAHDNDDAFQQPAKRARLEHHPPGTWPEPQLSAERFTLRPFAEQQTALSLVQFGGHEEELNLSRDRIGSLVGALIAEAPSEVADRFAESETRGSDSRPASPSRAAAKQLAQQRSARQKEREELEILQKLISKKLESLAEKEVVEID